MNTGYREDPINSPHYKRLIREVFMRDVKTATDLILYSLLTNYSQPSTYIDVMGYSHDLKQEYTINPQPLDAFEVQVKMEKCNVACHKRQDEIEQEGVLKPIDCQGICHRHVSSLHRSPVMPYRLLVYFSDKNMIRLREWMINLASKLTGSSITYIEVDEQDEAGSNANAVIRDYTKGQENSIEEGEF